MTKFIDAEKGACFRCLVGEGFRRRENVCDVIGVANITVSLTATIATTLALKYLLGLPVEDELFMVDAFDLIIEKIKIYKNLNALLVLKKNSLT